MDHRGIHEEQTVDGGDHAAGPVKEVDLLQRLHAVGPEHFAVQNVTIIQVRIHCSQFVDENRFDVFV